MSRRWLGSADVQINDANGALLVEQVTAGNTGGSGDAATTQTVTGQTTLAANATRRGLVIQVWTDGGAGSDPVNVYFAGDTSTQPAALRLRAGQIWEMPLGYYTGAVTIASGSSFEASVTEIV